MGACSCSAAAGQWVGGLLLFGAAVTAGSFAAGELMTYLVGGGITDGPAVVAMGLVSSLRWLVGIFPVILFLPQLFPDGTCRPAAGCRSRGCALAVLAFLGVSLLFGQDPGRLVGQRRHREPLLHAGPGGSRDPRRGVRRIAHRTARGQRRLPGARFRRSSGVERQQIKWVALAVAFLASSFVLSTVASAIGLNGDLIDSIVSGIAFITLPVAVAVAVLQYHLYDLDVVVKKALVAGRSSCS